MADEESRTQGLKDRGFPTLVGLDDDVEPLAQPFDRQGLAELAEIVEADPPQLEAHAWLPRGSSTKSRSIARRPNLDSVRPAAMVSGSVSPAQIGRASCREGVGE